MIMKAIFVLKCLSDTKQYVKILKDDNNKYEKGKHICFFRRGGDTQRPTGMGKVTPFKTYIENITFS